MAVVKLLKRYWHDCNGVTMIEYGLILAVAALVILALAGILGSAAIDNFNALDAEINQAQQETE